jgi:hypothetical protein
MRKTLWGAFLLLSVMSVLLNACQPQEQSPFAQEKTPTVTASPVLLGSNTPPATALPTSTAAPSPTPSPAPMLWIDPALPQQFQQLSLPEGLARAAKPEEAALELNISDQEPVSSWIFALVAPFSTILDGISAQELRQAWAGQPSSYFPESPLLVDQSTYQILNVWWGEPASKAVKILPAEDLVEFSWQTAAWAIVPFEKLAPRWKVLEIDGLSPIRNDFDPQNYALSIPISLVGQSLPIELKDDLLSLLPTSNRDPGQLTTLILTGVTALVRGTALTIEARGVTYPAQDIRDWLRQADILHISNEIPFYDQCPFPELYPVELKFCSNPRYFSLLEDIGTDLVELSGDHFGDYGTQAMEQTLQLYQAKGLPYYGGGATLSEGRQPLLLEHHGNRLAFLGCNAKGISFYAPASADKPGAAACDFDLLTSEIGRLKAQGYLVIVTFQDEEYYSYQAQPKLIANFRAAAQAGANIVSGSQAHQPHGMEFFNQAFIHYGLGNLFFDQYRFFPGPELDRAFIDRHVFYAGRYISTELLPIRFTDLAHSRPMNAEEKADFLRTIFAASNWSE